MKRIPILYFSDILCVWAYWAQTRIDEVARNFGEQVEFQPRFCSVFGDTAHKMATGWAAKGGYDGFRAHLMRAAEGFPEAPLNPAIWEKVRPASSLAPHLVLKAIQIGISDGDIAPGVFDRAVIAMRRGFFEQARDIGQASVQHEIAQAAGADMAVVTRLLECGRAHAALSTDYKDAESMQVQGSPTFLLNEGRQKLYGNVGYRIIEANIQEVLRTPSADQASWC